MMFPIIKLHLIRFHLKPYAAYFDFYCLKYHYRDNVFVQYAVVASMSLLIYYLVLGERYPAVVIRLSDIAVFLTVSTFILLRNTHLNFIIKVILLFLLCLITHM